MTSSARVPLTVHHARTAVSFSNARLGVARGIRAAIATIVPLLVADIAGRPLLAWTAVGGWMAALADTGGSYRTRTIAQSSFAVAGALSCLVASLVGGDPWLAVPLMLVWGFTCAMARALGDSGATIGSLICGTFVAAMGSPTSSVPAALTRAELVLAGAVWAMVLTLVVWPINPFGPARRAVAACYEALAEFASSLGEPATGATIDHAGAVRTAIENARSVIATTRGRRRGASERGEALLALLEDADRLFGALLALDAMLPDDERPARAQAIAAAADRLDAMARAIADWKLTRERDAAATAVRELGVTWHLTSEKPTIESEAPASPWMRITTALAPGSVVSRHALRVAVTTAATTWMALAFHIQRGYWITLTALVVLQPYAGATVRRGAQRVGGSVIGGLIAAALAELVRAPLAIAALMFPLSVASVALLPLNYGAFVLFLTPVFVLMAEPYPGDWRIAVIRVSNTLIGGAIALVAGLVLWPAPERRRTPAYLADAIRAVREFLALAGDGTSTTAEVDAARRRAGVALNNADASLQRLLDESRHDDQRVESVMTIASYSRRIAAATTALGRATHAGHASRESLDVVRAAAAAMEELEHAITDERAPSTADLPSTTIVRDPVERAPLERIVGAIEVMRSAVRRGV